MKKLSLFLTFCFLIITTNGFGVEKLEKTWDSEAAKAESVDKAPAVTKVEDKLDNKRLERARLELESKKDKAGAEKNSLLHIALMYIPNRIIDLTDIVTAGIGFGPEASLELTATKYCQIGAAYGDRYFLEKGYNRQYGGGYYSGYNASFTRWYTERAFNDYTFGTIKPYVIVGLDSSERYPDRKPYSDGIRDFWKIGFHFGWIFDVGVHVHPVAIANFLTGFFLIRLTDTEEM